MNTASGDQQGKAFQLWTRKRNGKKQNKGLVAEVAENAEEREKGKEISFRIFILALLSVPQRPQRRNRFCCSRA